MPALPRRFNACPVNHKVNLTRWMLPALVAVLLLLAWQPLLQGQVPWRGDGLLHFYRLAQLERAVRSGVLYPRWSPDLGYGYGFPLFNYYAPFSYLVSLPLRLSGLPLTTSLQMSYALALFVLGCGAYLWGRALWQNWMAGVTAVLATIYTPYILYNTYHRASLAELWGLAWLVMTLWAIHRAITRERPASQNHQSFDSLSTSSRAAQDKPSIFTQSPAPAAVCYALLLLSHNITALIGTPLIVGYGAFLAWGQRRSRQTFASSSMLLFTIILLGAALSAFFWLPAFFERNAVKIENLTGSANFAYANHFLSPAELLAWPQTADPTQVNPDIPRSLSWPVVILALLAWLPGKKGGQDQSFKSHRLALTLASLACLFMTLPASRPVWDAIPLLAFVQFPWRFLGPATISLALLAAVGAARWFNCFSANSRDTYHKSGKECVSNELARWPDSPDDKSTGYPTMPDQSGSSRRPPFQPGSPGVVSSPVVYGRAVWLSRYGVILAILLFSLPWLFPSPSPALPKEITPVDTIRFEAETGWLGTTAAADYLPRTVSELPPAGSLIPRYQAAPPDGYIARLDSSLLPDSFIAEDYQEQFTSTSFHYQSLEAVTAVFAWYAFPGWSATLDGQPLETGIQEPHGLITAVLPPGSHTFQLAFGSTPLRTFANTLSLISISLLLILIILPRRHPRPEAAQPKAGEPKVVIALSLPVLLLFALKTIWLDQANTLFRRAAFDGQQVTGVNTTARVNFGDELLLLGADLPAQPIPADQPLDVTLFWQALPPVQAEYSVSVQVIAANGRRYGQGDSFHPAGLPVTRWQANEYGRDPHAISLLSGAPPGAYQLVVFVYNTVTGQRLDVLNEAGLPLGSQHVLGTVTIAAPTGYPDPAALPISQRTAESGTAPFLAEGVQLLGFDQPLPAPTAGDVLPLTLYWYTPQAPDRDYEADVWLSCANQGVITHLPANDRFAPNTSWQAGQVQRADYNLLLLPLVENGRYLVSGLCTLYLRLAAADESTSIALETFPVTAPPHNFDLPAGAEPVAQGLAGLVTLAAYDLDQTTLFPGSSLALTLYWRAERVMETSYTVFVQVLGADGRILAQQDRLPADGARPTTGWVPGEIIGDAYTLAIPPDAAPGVYQIIVGMYDGRSGSRLPRQDQTGDAITLPSPIEVKTAK